MTDLFLRPRGGMSTLPSAVSGGATGLEPPPAQAPWSAGPGSRNIATSYAAVSTSAVGSPARLMVGGGVNGSHRHCPAYWARSNGTHARCFSGLADFAGNGLCETRQWRRYYARGPGNYAAPQPYYYPYAPPVYSVAPAPVYSYVPPAAHYVPVPYYGPRYYYGGY